MQVWGTVWLTAVELMKLRKPTETGQRASRLSLASGATGFGAAKIGARNTGCDGKVNLGHFGGSGCSISAGYAVGHGVPTETVDHSVQDSPLL